MEIVEKLKKVENEAKQPLEPGQVSEVGKASKQYKLKVHKLQVLAHFHLVDEEGNVVNETTAQPINLFPAKFIPLKELVKKLEDDANKQEENLQTLAAASLW